MRQSKVDSLLETLTNTFVGFVVALLTYQFIVNPLYGLQSSFTESLGVTTIFTVASILRQYVLRRVFDGKSVYQAVRDLIRRRRLHESQ